MGQENRTPETIHTFTGEGEEHTRLRITLLGTPAISWDGQILAIPRRRVRALLYRLSANLRPISRDELCFLFWSDHPPEKARRNLTHLLTHLRLALPDADLVDVSKESVALDPLRVWSDTVAFDRLLAGRKELALAAHGLEADIQPALQAVERAVRSYQGAFLSALALPGCQEYEAWISRERRGYECQLLEALLDLVGFYQDNREYETAITYANRYLEIDNLAESIHSKLIELYAAKGDRSAAERQFERCVAVLEQELGISPSPKTWAIFQSAVGPKTPGMMLPSQALADRSQSRLETPFVGRADILEQVDRVYNLACLGHARVVLVHGEPGIGKSRLLQQIAARYRCQATVLFSAANPGIADLPYHLVAEAFRSALETHAAMIKQVNPLWLAEVARLLPEIYQRAPGLPEPLPTRPEEARRRLFEALYQFATTLSSRTSPLLLCLDDLHWADATTLEWLIYLGNRLAFDGLGHLLVIGTFRDEDSGRLEGMRFALNRLRVLEELHLAGLRVETVLALLGHLSASSKNNPELAARLHQISGGNPNFLIETIRVLMEGDPIPAHAADFERLPISRAVQGAVHQRLAGLGASQRKILEIAAVMKGPFTTALMLKTAEKSELEILDCLDDLTARNLLTRQDGSYRFQHELVQMVIYSDLSYDRKQLLHRQCARFIEHTQPEDYAALAWHFEQGGEIHKAAGYALRAGEFANQAYAFPEALDFFSRALELLKQESASLAGAEEIAANYRKQILALSRRGSAFRVLGDLQSYQNDVEEEARIARVLGDENTLAHTYLREANAHRWYCRYLQAQECARKALQIGQKVGNAALQGRALREIGLAARATGDFASACTSLEAALQRFKDLGEIGFEIHTMCNLSTLHASMGEFRLAEQLAASALGRCDQEHRTHLRRTALGDLGVALAGLGLEQQARECLLASLEIAQQICDRTQEIFCLCHLGWLENDAGKPEAALHYLSDGLALAERFDSRAEQSRLYTGLADAHRQLRNSRLAKAFAYKALELAKKHGQPNDINLAEQVLAELKVDL